MSTVFCVTIIIIFSVTINYSRYYMYICEAHNASKLCVVVTKKMLALLWFIPSLTRKFMFHEKQMTSKLIYQISETPQAY